MLIVSAEQMRTIESNSLKYDLTMPRLMENAGSAAAKAITDIADVKSIGCVVFSGRGNNGGDGFVVARRLYEQGAHVLLVLVDGTSKTPQAAQMYSFLSVLEIPVLTLPEDLELVRGYSMNADLIVDAIYGIGFRGRLDGNAKLATQIINSADAKVVSLDTPSGIEADKGNISVDSVRANHTIAFEFLKPLHIFPQSAKYCGKIETVDIGIPAAAYQDVSGKFNFLTENRVWEVIKKRSADAHKGMFGRLLCICGSQQYRGAALLAAKAAYRSGVGVCSVAAPEPVCAAVSAQIPEVVFQPMSTNPQNEIDFMQSLPLLEKEIQSSSAVLFGCGFGDDPAGEIILEFLIEKLRVPLVLDADGLNILARKKELLYRSKTDIIITPHPGEMSRLTGISVPEVQKDRISTAENFSSSYNTYTVLKGAGTIICTPQKNVFINRTGGPGLSKAGSGDILAGMIASLLAQGVPAADACCAAVWLHGKSGEMCAERLSETSMLPSEILDDLTVLFKKANR